MPSVLRRKTSRRCLMPTRERRPLSLHSLTPDIQTKRANELDKDMNAWEENRMLTAGVVRLKQEISLDFDDENEKRVLLLVSLDRGVWLS